MRQTINKIAALMSVVFISAAVGGCKDTEIISHKPVPEDGYVTDVSQSAIEYTIFMADCITKATNFTSARYAVAQQIINGKYSIDAEKENAETTLKSMEEVRDDATKMMPAQSYENVRQDLIDVLQDCVDHLTQYKTALENKNKKEISGTADLLWGDYLALTGLQQTD